MHLNHFRYTSNGLGGFDVTFQSLRFAHGKHHGPKQSYAFLFLVYLSSMNFRTRLDISVLSLIICGQTCLETFELITCKCNLRRVTSLHANQNKFLCIRLTKILTTCIFAAWISIIILLSGDIHENPGPDSVTSLAEEESDLSSCSTESIDHLISMMHLNIQSIVPKMDLVRTESMAYDIMVFSESWNNLPLRVRQSESLPIFKSRLFANNTPWPSYYNAGSRVGQILHTRIRLDCSALNYYRNRRKLIDSKLCECGEVENAKQFILQCPLFNEHRT